MVVTKIVFTLTCSCGWAHEATTRGSATSWKKWHREIYCPKGSRVSDESDHKVTVKKETKYAQLI